MTQRRRLLTGIAIALVGLSVTLVSMLPGYVTFMGLRWWEVAGQCMGGGALVLMGLQVCWGRE